MSIYPVKIYGFTNWKISMGMNNIAAPINTILIVDMIGVTLFLEKDENIKQSNDTVIIIIFEKAKPRKNLKSTLSLLGSNANKPSWKTINKPESKTKYDTTIVYAKKYNIIVVVYNNTTATFDINSFVRDIGLVRYILKVPFEYSPDIISDGTIVDKKGICEIRMDMIMYAARKPFTALTAVKNISCIWSDNFCSRETATYWNP